MILLQITGPQEKDESPEGCLLVGRHFVKDVGYEACLLGQLSLNKQKVEGGPGEGNVRS